MDDLNFLGDDSKLLRHVEQCLKNTVKRLCLRCNQIGHRCGTVVNSKRIAALLCCKLTDGQADQESFFHDDIVLAVEIVGVRDIRREARTEDGTRRRTVVWKRTGAGLRHLNILYGETRVGVGVIGNKIGRCHIADRIYLCSTCY